LLGYGLDDILLIIQPDIRLTGGDEGDGIVGIGGKAKGKSQTFFFEISLHTGRHAGHWDTSQERHQDS